MARETMISPQPTADIVASTVWSCFQRLSLRAKKRVSILEVISDHTRCSCQLTVAVVMSVQPGDRTGAGNAMVKLQVRGAPDAATDRLV